MDGQVHKTPDEARAGSTPHVVRYVLAVSLALAVLTMLVLLLWGFTGT